MTGDDHPAPRNDVAPIRARLLKHMPKINLRKAAIGPLTLRQRSHPAFVHRNLLPDRLASRGAHLRRRPANTTKFLSAVPATTTPETTSSEASVARTGHQARSTLCPVVR